MPIARRRSRDAVHPCDHVPLVRSVTPNSQGCLACLSRGGGWFDLYLCLSCGWVACSDDSPGHHARAHYEETDHPVAVRLLERDGPRWCYVHRHEV
jgi:uncharacterized UBP type Zn finger protein